MSFVNNQMANAAATIISRLQNGTWKVISARRLKKR